MTPKNAEKYFGFILLKLITNENQNRLVEFLCAHNTQTMLVGYMNTSQNQVTVSTIRVFIIDFSRLFFFFVKTLFSELHSNDPISINIDSIRLTKN